MTGRDWFAAVLAEIADEHHRAVEQHGYDEEHDDTRSDADFGWLLLRRVSELVAPETVLATTSADRRRAFVEVTHIAASAVAAHDRRRAADPLPEPVTVADLREQQDLPPVVATSADASWRYVTRPADDSIERHALGCTRWRASTGEPCHGECADATTPEATDERTI